MARFTFLHAADLNLDAPFAGVGRLPADVARSVRDASLDAWAALVDLAVARDVAAVLLAGGLCDGLQRGARAPARLREGLQRLVAHGIAVYAALGGRDAAAGLAGLDLWPPGVTRFDEGVQAVALERDGTHLATVHGIGTRGGDAAALVRRLMTERDGAPHLGLLHAALERTPDEAAPDAACAEAALRAADLDYWALGHGADFAVLARGPAWIVRAGSPQGRAIGTADAAAKGAVLVDVADGVIEQVALEPLDRVRCLPVAVGDAPDPEALRRALEASAGALRAGHAERVLLLEAVVTGGPAALRALRRADAGAALLRELRRTAARWDPVVWWTGLRLGLPPEPAVGRDTLAGEVRRLRTELGADPAQRARFLARRFEPLRSTWTADVEPREAEELLDGAAALALDALDDAEGGR